MTTAKTEIGKTASHDKKVEPAAVPAVIIPKAFECAPKDMAREQLGVAIALGEQYPAIVLEATNLKAAINDADGAVKRMGQKYYGFCSELRKAKMERKQATILLLGLGFIKQRITEILKVSEVSDELWAKFAAGEVTFKSTLAIERGTSCEGDEGDGEGTEGGDKAKKKAKSRKLPKEVQTAIVEALEATGSHLKDNKLPYLFSFSNKDGRVFMVTLNVTDKE